MAGTGFAWERTFSKADIKRFAGDPVPQGPILALVTDVLEDKEHPLQAQPGCLFTIPHFNSYPAVLMHLEKADESDLREARLDAWLVHAPSGVARTYLEQRGE